MGFCTRERHSLISDQTSDLEITGLVSLICQSQQQMELCYPQHQAVCKGCQNALFVVCSNTLSQLILHSIYKTRQLVDGSKPVGVDKNKKKKNASLFFGKSSSLSK